MVAAVLWVHHCQWCSLSTVNSRTVCLCPCCDEVMTSRVAQA